MEHLQPRVLQGIEFPSLVVLTLIVIGLDDFGGSGNCFSLALTSVLARFLVLLKLRHGLGTLLVSLPLGLSICLSVLGLSLGCS